MQDPETFTSTHKAMETTKNCTTLRLRFDLSLKFLGEEERKITSELIKRLEEVNLEDDMENKCKVTKNVEILQELRKIYGIPTEIAS